MINEFKCRKYIMPIGKKTYNMAILNITPDSFFDGGKYVNTEVAINKAKQMVKDGADIIDIGGQSTRPGHEEITVEEELDRILPTVEILVKELDVPISVDTYRSEVVEKVLEAGAHIINDIWGLKRDANIANIVAKYDAGLILMHNKEDNKYIDIMKDITNSLDECMKVALKAGVKKENIMIDPGIGAPYGKDVEQQYEILARLRELRSLGVPILHAVSRKSFLGAVTRRDIDERLAATIASVSLGIERGADFVRVHDIKEIRDTILIADKIVRR